MGSSQQFSLRWNNYLKHITCAFDNLRTDEDLVDVTLSCEGKRIRAHKMLLSACSTYFRDLFKENPCQHPVIIFRNVKFDDLAALVDFMYQGEVNVVQEQLASFLTTAELLAVQGLTDGTGKDNDSIMEDEVEAPNEPEVQLQNSSAKTSSEKDKGNKSPYSPMPFQSVDLPDAPPNKKRKRESSTTNVDKTNTSTEESENKTSSDQAVSDPVEIIPLMPNLKLEMPEYLEQDGSSCSYEEQSIGDSSLNKIGPLDSSVNLPDHDHKPDISHFYSSNQSTSDGLDHKHQSSDVGHLLSKPGTSGERLSQDAVQGKEMSESTSSPVCVTIDDSNPTPPAPSLNSFSSFGYGEQEKVKSFSDFIPAGIRVRSDISLSQVENADLKSKDDIASPTPTIEDYCKRIIRMITTVNMHLTMIDRRLSAIENKGRGLPVPEETTDDIILPLLPLTTPEEIHGFENFISTTEKAAMQFKSLVLKTGGNNLRDNIYRVLKKVFSNSCAALCSWKGHRNNFGVSELLTIKLIRSVICSLNPPLTEAKFDSMAAEWFRFAKQRLGREKPK